MAGPCNIRLAYECVRTNSPSDKLPVIMLHGSTDSKEAWDGIYQVIPSLTQRTVYVYDARNHGDSGWSDTFNLDALAEDLGNFMRDMKVEKASLVGHSLGGLTIMKFALKNPSKVESIFVEDVSPLQPRGEVAAFIRNHLKTLLESLSAIPDDADDEMAEKAVTDYITNVIGIPPTFKKFPFRCRDGVWEWKYNIKVSIKVFEDLDSFRGKMEGQYNGRAFFIYGTASPIKVPEDEEIIRKFFPNSEMFGVEGADHFVHTHAEVFLNSLVKFLNRE